MADISVHPQAKGRFSSLL